MRKSVIYLVALMFLLATAAVFAGNAKPDSKSSSSGCPMMGATGAKAEAMTDSTGAAKMHEGCPMMGKDAKATATGAKDMTGCPMMKKAADKAETPSTAAEQTSATKGGAAAAVTTAKATDETGEMPGKAEFENFHNVLHPMHMALKDGKYDEIKSSMPKLMEASKGLAASKCPMPGKCTPDCMKSFETKKASLMKAVDGLDAACKTNDNKQIETSFNTMHTAYYDLAAMCGQPTEKTSATQEAENK